ARPKSSLGVDRALLAPSLAIFRHQGYLHYWIMRQLVSAARQMVMVALAWQVYGIARAPLLEGGLGWDEKGATFLTGLIGLTIFVPVLLFSLIGGQAADRLNKKYILIAAHLVRFLAFAAFAVSVSLPAQLALPVIFTGAVVLGVIYAFVPAASNALFPTLVPRQELPQAIAWNSLGYQSSSILGPAVAGLLITVGLPLVYVAGMAMSLGALLAIATAVTPAHVKQVNARGLAMIWDGLRYVASNKTVLGAISLDLVAVFFAGSVALLPVYARDILEVGPQGYGLLWSATAIGAAAVAAILATRPLTRRVGQWMFGAVALFGVSIIVFGLSTFFWLSFIALVIHGAADMISVFVRQSLIQLATPDAMKGRVTSVSFIFIAGSNELGEFQSGVATRSLGPVGAVLLGGTVAIAAAGIWMRLFPQLATADRFEDVKEEPLSDG
ncbi:MAG: MFS transporter, partial [Pseudomonadota bacterium]